ncbi:Neuronal acetylcholine receptor subunit beta-3 [Exaiptasia diaphana]|nr:Neuronal acetylcholine receptor subunit beta-3 [Exaiptasia diaphana]
MELRKIMKIDSKAQELTVGVTVTQRWRNVFLAWDRVGNGNIETITVSANEIWTPDIGLINNADLSTSVAGGKIKFQTDVIVSNDGDCFWKSPATFTSYCDIDVQYWPFDTQKCEMSFGSYTLPSSKLKLILFNQTNTKANRFKASGDWTVNRIKVERKRETSANMEFGIAEFELELERKPMYFILNLIIPSVVLCVLSLLSFAIPSESGERIGFITTLLLAMTVYLLLISEVLPETSNQLPITGLLFVLTIIESAVILVVTIVVLRCFHGTGKPYGWLQWLYRRCCCCCCKKSIIRITPSPLNIKEVELHSVVNAAELPENPSIQVADEDDIDPSWQDIAGFLNSIFFVLCFLMVTCTYLAILLYAILK